MIRLADGDRSAFAPTFELLWPLVRRFAGRALAGAPEAEDAAQEALVKVFSRISQFDRTRAALPWVLSVVTCECRTYRQRERRRRLSASEQAEVQTRELDPEQTAITRDLEAALHDAMLGLNPTDVATLQAVLSECRTGVADATFRKRLSRALARLRITWKSRHEID